MKRFADVIVDISASETDKLFEYSFTDDLITVGSRVVVPFGRTFIEGIVIKVKDSSDFSPEKIKPVARLLEEMPALTPEMLELSEYVMKTCYVTRASSLRLFLPVEMRKGKVREQFITLVNLTENLDVESVIQSLRKSAVKQIDALLYLKDNKKAPNSALSNMFGAGAINSLVEKGYLYKTQEKFYRSPYKNLDVSQKKITLTLSQQNAINSIEQTDKTTSLIFGVTGSGKTEIYLELIDRTIKNGKTAIMLVPEIALTPQMLRQLRARFGENAAILHSGLSSGERFDEWWRLRTGEAKIAIGARSAVFAPLENIGLIIIDEEHDNSYTSESSPRYSTIDVAKTRSKNCNAKLVLGSATPSVDSYLNAVNGEYNLIELSQRINKKPLPQVQIVDMRNEIRRGNSSPFSNALLTELENALDSGNQAMIFLNQRGYSKTVICTECGHVQTCENCDVSLTYHKEDDALLCHYCGAKYKMITACTECGSPYIKYGGVGTERVVMELKKFFPDAKILRMDRDTTQNKDSHFKILTEFSERKADILVGTQMIAKGHDFPSVTLVGILDADMSLHFSDYRSGERTFQLITQVAGRSGRAENAGKVVLQTYSPNNEILKLAVDYDYKGFFENEIAVRKATAFPPYSKILRVLVSSTDEEKAISVTKSIYEELNLIRDANKHKFFFYGCMKAPLKKLQNKFRFQVLMRIDDKDNVLSNAIFGVINKYNGKNVGVYLEINPNNLT